MRSIYIIFIILLTSGYIHGQKYRYDYTGSATGNNFDGSVTYTIETEHKCSDFTFYKWKYGNRMSLHKYQEISNYITNENPSGTVTTESDDLGNDYIKVHWQNPNTKSVQIEVTYDGNTGVYLRNFTPGDPFPLLNPGTDLRYLQATDSIQKDDAAIKSKAQEITEKCKDVSLRCAVEEIARWINGNVDYQRYYKYKDASTSEIAQDAKSVFEERTLEDENGNTITGRFGNCLGFSSLMVAMLRSVDIPARLIGGRTYDKIYQMDTENGTMTTGGGSGPHAMYEVYFPSIGSWVSGDPQSQLFFNDQNNMIGCHGFQWEGNNSDECSYTSSVWIHGTNCGQIIPSDVSFNTSIESITNNYQYKDFDEFPDNTVRSGDKHLLAVYTGDKRIDANKTWNSQKYVDGDIIVHNGATLTITDNLGLSIGSRIVVHENSNLIIDGGFISGGSIFVKSGGYVRAENNAKLHLYGDETIQGEVGGEWEIKESTFDLVNIESHTFQEAQPDEHYYFSKYYDETYLHKPVILMGPASYNAQPVTMRIQSVFQDHFQWQFDEWDYQSGSHPEEQVNCLILRKGVSTLGGLKALTGYYGSNYGIADIFSSHFRTINLQSNFTNPVVICQVASNNGSQAVTVRLGDIQSNSFASALQEQELNIFGFHEYEQISFLVIEQGTGIIQGNHKIEVGTVSADDAFTTINFNESFTDPVFIAQIQTYNGSDPCELRYRNLTGSSVEIMIQEEESYDSERSHASETVGYVVYE
jgi:transglutaminase-like putative cysteine protease